jgi:arabinogalactan endo-1,4-beta-galactosidase
MKKMHKRAMALCLTAALCSGLFAGCGGEKNTAETQQATEAQAADVQTESSDIYVEKIDGISDDFIRGMDASEVLSLENSGVKYYDYDGNEQDILRHWQILVSIISACVYGMIHMTKMAMDTVVETVI